MKKITLSFTFMAAILGMSTAYSDGCTNPRNAYDQTYCMAKLFLESDNELNKTYNALKNTVSNEVKPKLVSAQRQWIHFRDNACSFGGTIAVDCNFKVNKARLVYLQDRLRECKTGHCQNQLIAATDFHTPE